MIGSAEVESTPMQKRLAIYLFKFGTGQGAMMLFGCEGNCGTDGMAAYRWVYD